MRIAGLQPCTEACRSIHAMAPLDALTSRYRRNYLQVQGRRKTEAIKNVSATCFCCMLNVVNLFESQLRLRDAIPHCTQIHNFIIFLFLSKVSSYNLEFLFCI